MLSDNDVGILRLINQFGPLSRAELVDHMGISKASMSALAADLIERGVLTQGETVYGAGRPSVRLELSASSAFLVGVSLATTPFTLTLTDLSGGVIAEEQLREGAGPDAVVANIAATVDRLLAPHPEARAKLAGIGVAVPGVVNAEQGVCIRSTLLDWRNVPVGPLLAQATGIHVYVENDANALVLGEHLFGSLRGSDYGTLIAVGDGIGCGHIVKGDLHRGARGGAGEIAHSTIELGGMPCQCGKRGCLDTLASIRSISAAARAAGLGPSLTELDAAANRGERAAIDILHGAGAALGLAIAQIIQSLDPERIVVGMSDGPIDGLFSRVVRQTVEANIMPDDGRRLELTVTRLENRAWAVGAASVAAGRGFFRV